MAASYPSSIKVFTTKTDNVDPVVASDVNLAYSEITALETLVGVEPSKQTGWSGTFDTTTTDFGSLSARVLNIEYGLYTAYNNRVKTNGGSTITPSSGSVTGLVIKSASDSGSGNLFEARNESNTVVTAIGPKGWILAIDGGTAN